MIEEIQQIQNALQTGLISQEEHDHMIREIRDVHAAEQCAGNEVLFRQVVQMCNIALKMV